MPYQEFSSGTQIDPARLAGLSTLARLLPLHKQKKILNDQAGVYSSALRGRGIDFSEVREYQSGDDIRAMDWRVTARTDTPHIKVFREERVRPVLLVCDLRASMNFGTRRALKRVVAADITALFGWSAIANGDRIGSLIFNDSEEHDLRPKTGRKALMALLHQLSNMPLSAPVSKSERMLQICRHIARVARPGTAIYIISDWQGFDEECERALYPVSRHCDLTAVHISDPFESQLPTGDFALTDGEHRSSLHITAKARDQHIEQWQQSLSELRHRMNRLRIPLTLISTHADPLDQLRPGFGFGGGTGRTPGARQ